MTFQLSILQDNCSIFKATDQLLIYQFSANNYSTITAQLSIYDFSTVNSARQLFGCWIFIATVNLICSQFNSFFSLIWLLVKWLTRQKEFIFQLFFFEFLFEETSFSGKQDVSFFHPIGTVIATRCTSSWTCRSLEENFWVTSRTKFRI